jgi:hypothetical protein
MCDICDAVGWDVKPRPHICDGGVLVGNPTQGGYICSTTITGQTTASGSDLCEGSRLSYDGDTNELPLAGLLIKTRDNNGDAHNISTAGHVPSEECISPDCPCRDIDSAVLADIDDQVHLRELST